MKNPTRIALRDIAEKAGVTRMSVSLALRGKPGISAETRRVILQAAKELGYRPDPEVAKLLAHIRTRSPSQPHDGLALITTGKHADAWKQSNTERKFIEGAVARARDYGYRLEPFWLDDPDLMPERLLNILWNRGVEGIILAPLVGRGPDRASRVLNLDFSRFSVVQISDTIESPLLNCAIHDQYTSMLRLLDQLAALNYRRMGLVLEEALDLRVRRRWTAGFLQYREQGGPPRLPPPLILAGPHQKSFDRWMAKYSPDVLISLNGFAHRLLRSHRVRIPEELGYASLDLDGELADQPGLSGLDQNCQLVGEVATDMLVSAIHRGQRGVPLHPVRTEVEGTWIEGRSLRRQRG